MLCEAKLLFTLLFYLLSGNDNFLSEKREERKEKREEYKKKRQSSDENCRFFLERKSYIDRISCYGFKCEGTVANGHLWFQIKGYGFKVYSDPKNLLCFERSNFYLTANTSALQTGIYLFVILCIITFYGKKTLPHRNREILRSYHTTVCILIKVFECD